MQAGIRWCDIQRFLDPHDLSVKIMQSYSNFTIGGALSVNAHGRYVALGPLINSVRRIQLILPGGVVTEVSPAGDFWQAEPEHQDYLQHYPNGYTCHFIRPGWKLPRRASAET